MPDNTNRVVQQEWLVVRASVVGRSHKESDPPIPCQDSSFYQHIGQGWGVAVVCDGAGSKEYSHYGSEFVANQAGLYFIRIVEENAWQATNSLPLPQQWHEICRRALAKIRSDLEEYAREHNLASESLSSTLIVLVHAPNGVLATHIGDGRAAFRNVEEEWKAVIVPLKGEEANQTVFVTSVDWNHPDKYIESAVFAEKPHAFAVLTDGCESHSFEVNIFDAQEQKYYDPNRPYSKFFDPLVAALKVLHQDGVSDELIRAKWQRFIESGTDGLRNEPDDKTMVLGVLIN
jgi:protein phosphatase 2C-like protein